MNDTVHIVKSDGLRLGPYKAAVSANSITIMEKSVDVDEGDHVARLIPSGKEEIYLVLLVEYSPGLGSIPPSYSLKTQKTTAIVQAPRGATRFLVVSCGTCQRESIVVESGGALC